MRQVDAARLRRARHADRLRDHGHAPCAERQEADLVLSGVNRGGNLAEDVTYSGTIAGAFEGTQMGIRSIALSQAYRL